MNESTKAPVTSESPKPKTPEDERAELLLAKEKLEKVRAEKARKMKDEVLKLELRFEGEIGARGDQFEIVETVEGPIAVRLGEGILHQRFTKSEVTEVDVNDFVYPCVIYPAKEKYSEIALRRPDIANRCAHALMGLYGSRHKTDAGKF